MTIGQESIQEREGGQPWLPEGATVGGTVGTAKRPLLIVFELESYFV